jgi:multisubunit Na+/H+ antiporter MnhE subunit
LDAGPKHDGMSGAARAWGAWWVLLAALYLLLADNVVLPELVVGAVAAAVGATGAVLCRSQRRELLRPRPRWLLAAWRPLLGIFTDLLPLGRTLIARGSGDLVRVPVTVPADGGEQAAFVAFTEALGSLAPNTIVVDLDREQGVLIVHQLAPTAAPAAPLTP